jgi:hypothetical protein
MHAVHSEVKRTWQAQSRPHTTQLQRDHSAHTVLHLQPLIPASQPQRTCFRGPWGPASEQFSSCRHQRYAMQPAATQLSGSLSTMWGSLASMRCSPSVVVTSTSHAAYCACVPAHGRHALHSGARSHTRAGLALEELGHGVVEHRKVAVVVAHCLCSHRLQLRGN